MADDGWETGEEKQPEGQGGWYDSSAEGESGGPEFHPVGKQKTPRSPGMKILMILLGISGVCMLLCCGGFGFFAYQFSQSLIDDPEEVKEITQEIIAIELSEDFQPLNAMVVKDYPLIPIPDMRIVGYQYKSNQGILILGEIDTTGDAAGGNQFEEAIRQSPQKERSLKNLEELETREYDVEGKPVKFRFIRGENEENGKVYRQIEGQFDNAENKRFLIIQIEEENYDPEVVQEILESLK